MMDLYHPIGIVSYLPIDMDSGEIKPAQPIAKEVRTNFEPRFYSFCYHSCHKILGIMILIFTA